MSKKTLDSNSISEVTRRNIFDYLSLSNFNWSGRLNEVEFLERIFDLNNLHSTDFRFSTAYNDIWQHRVRNNDWRDDWVFYDERFDLVSCDDSTFLEFLCLMFHPVVRLNKSDAETVLNEMNNYLERDGYEIYPAAIISERPVFASRLLSVVSTCAFMNAKEELAKVDETYIMQQMTRMEASMSHDPEAAIGTAKELIETVCKTILDLRGEKHSSEDKLQKLFYRTCDSLSLTPDSIDNEKKASKTIKKILGNFIQISQGIAELRNQYGTGHGKKAGTIGLLPRHARLAVNAASTLALFLWETHLCQNKSDAGSTFASRPPANPNK